MYVKYSNYDKINNKLGITLYSGENKYEETIVLNDNNYFEIFNSGNLTFNLNSDKAYFQTKDISDFVYNLFKTKYKKKIMNTNMFKSRYDNNNDIFIHIRLGDVRSKNPGIQYYLNALKHIKDYDNIIISSDSPNHIFVRELLKNNRAKLLIDDEIKTIQFGSTCKYLILSGGTFSCIIGYMGYYSTIFYPNSDIVRQKEMVWHGDIFDKPNWIPIPF